MKKLLSIRGTDKFGCGAFGASRDGGQRTHQGVDIITVDGDPFHSLCDGTVNSFGYAYKGNFKFRIVNIRKDNGDMWRYFYVEPAVELGMKIKTGQQIGTTQTLKFKYPGITPHVHFEIVKDKQHIDPTEFVEFD